MAENPTIFDADTGFKYFEKAIDLYSYDQAVAECDTACAGVKDYCLKTDLHYLGFGISKQYSHLQHSGKDANKLSRLAIEWLWLVQRK